jgi:hypothetical protein
MGEVLRYGQAPREIWRQHDGILAAVVEGDPARAEKRAIEHDILAADALCSALAER